MRFLFRHIITLVAVFALSLMSFAQSTDIPDENIVFSTDRELYLSGESIWFAGRVVSEEIPSNVIYIEVFNNDRELVTRTSYNAIGGVFSGKITLPHYLETGFYLVRVYTNYLRNYPVWLMPVKVIKVVNTTTPLPRNNFEHVKPKFALSENGDMCFQIPAHENIRDISLYKGNIQLDSNIVFFGNGLGKVVGIQDYQDSLSLHIETKDSISDQISIPALSNNLECSIKSSGSSYQVNVRSKNFRNTNISLRLTDISTGSVHSLTSELISGEASVVFKIPKPGMYLFEFKVADQVVETFAKYLNIEDFKPESDTELLIETATIKGSNLSMDSVLSEYLFSNPMYFRYEDYNCQFDNNTEQQINILLTLESDMIRNIVVKENETKQGYSKETYGPVISGKLVSGQREEGVEVYCSFIADESQFYVGKTDEKGRFVIEVGNTAQDGDVYISTKDGKNKEIEILNNFCADAPHWNPVHYRPDSSDSELLTRMYINSQFDKVYSNSYEFDSIPEKCYLPLMAGNLTTYRMSDYIQMASTQELINEVVMFVRVRKAQDGYQFTVLDDKTRVVYNNPLVILDNIYYPDIGEIMKLQPSEITHIDVISRKYYYGPLVFNGVIRINTTTGIREDMDIPGGGVFFKYNPPEDFKQMESNNKELSNTLFWRVLCSGIQTEGSNSEKGNWSFRTIRLAD